jgi:manganese transport protein
LGLTALFGPLKWTILGVEIDLTALILGLIAYVVLSQKSDKILTRILTLLVLFMSISFVITAFLIQPNISALLRGLLIPSLPNQSLWTVIGLIGTTIVPYNIFLHASLVKKKWNDSTALPQVKKDAYWTIGLGGLVSMSIVVCATGSGITEINSAADLAEGLKPLYGALAKILMGIGLFAAGLTSAITAPLAAAYVACGCSGWSADNQSQKFKQIWRLVLIVGVLLSATGIKPITVIQFAQVANGTLIFIIAGLVLWLVNKSELMKQAVNSRWQNIFGGLVFLVTLLVGFKGISGAIQLLF